MWSQIALISGRVGAKYLLSCYGYEWLFYGENAEGLLCSKYLQNICREHKSEPFLEPRMIRDNGGILNVLWKCLSW